MYEYLSMLLAVAIAIGAYGFLRIQERLQRTEAKLDAVLKHLGVEWGRFSEPSDRIKELASHPGTRVEAIKAYREQTGLGLKDAKDVIDALTRNQARDS